MPVANLESMRALLADTTAVLERLTALLEEEAERLAAQQVDGIEQLLADKQNALQAAHEADQKRCQLLTEAGFATGGEGMRAYLAACGDAMLATAWQHIIELLQRAQLLNEANGRIIHRSLDQVTRTLAILRGDAAAEAATYGPSGQTIAGPGRGSLSRA